MPIIHLSSTTQRKLIKILRKGPLSAIKKTGKNWLFYTVWLQQISCFKLWRIHGIFCLERAIAHKVVASGYG